MQHKPLQHADAQLVNEKEHMIWHNTDALWKKRNHEMVSMAKSCSKSAGGQYCHAHRPPKTHQQSLCNTNTWYCTGTHDARSTHLPKILPFSPVFFLMTNLLMVDRAVAIALAFARSCRLTDRVRQPDASSWAARHYREPPADRNRRLLGCNHSNDGEIILVLGPSLLLCIFVRPVTFCGAGASCPNGRP